MRDSKLDPHLMSHLRRVHCELLQREVHNVIDIGMDVAATSVARRSDILVLLTLENETKRVAFVVIHASYNARVCGTCAVCGKIIIKNAYAGQLNSFTHLRALLVLQDRGI